MPGQCLGRVSSLEGIQNHVSCFHASSKALDCSLSGSCRNCVSTNPPENRPRSNWFPPQMPLSCSQADCHPFLPPPQHGNKRQSVPASRQASGKPGRDLHRLFVAVEPRTQPAARMAGRRPGLVCCLVARFGRGQGQWPISAAGSWVSRCCCPHQATAASCCHAHATAKKAQRCFRARRDDLQKLTVLSLEGALLGSPSCLPF